MKEKLIDAYLKTALVFSKLSTATKLQVGSIIVKDNRIISIGYNGTPSGWDNVCEYKIYDIKDTDGNYTLDSHIHFPFVDNNGRYMLKTKPEVLHAEMNSLMKLARSTESGEGASMFITHSPCLECAKGILQAGIKDVYYINDYRSPDGIYFLNKCNIHVKKIIPSD
jgi:dCMP deaminase